MTRNERRRLLNADRKLAFGEELSALMAKYRYKLRASNLYVGLTVMNDDDKPHRFAIEGDGDLRDLVRNGWDDDRIVIERAYYEESVARGAWDSETDTEEEVEEAPKPKAKAKLTLPLTVGQKVICRDGSTNTVKSIEGDVAKMATGRLLWTANGCGNKDPLREPNDRDAISDA